MKRVTVSRARKFFPKLLKLVNEGEIFVLYKHKMKIACVVSLEYLEIIRLVERILEDKLDKIEITKALESIEKEGTKSWDDIKRELNL